MAKGLGIAGSVLYQWRKQFNLYSTPSGAIARLGSRFSQAHIAPNGILEAGVRPEENDESSLWLLDPLTAVPRWLFGSWAAIDHVSFSDKAAPASAVVRASADNAEAMFLVWGTADVARATRLARDATKCRAGGRGRARHLGLMRQAARDREQHCELLES